MRDGSDDTRALEPYRRGRPAEAERAAREALSDRPELASSFLVLGLLARDRGELDAALGWFELCARAAPDVAEHHLRLGETARSLGRAPQAIAALERAVALEPRSAEVRSALGTALMAAGRPAEAAARWREALACDPGFSKAHGNLGSALLADGKPAAALVHLEKARALMPGSHVVHTNLGNALRAGGRVDEAIASYRSALALKADYLPALTNLNSLLPAVEDAPAPVASGPGSEAARTAHAERTGSPLPPYSPPAPDRVPSYFLPLFWGTTNDAAVIATMKYASTLVAEGHFFADNLFTWARNLSMFDDAPFVAAWRSNCENDADRAIVWRRYVLACAAFHCAQLDGDFVECGAYTGVGIKTIVDYLGGVRFPKTFWGYDIFEHDATMANHAMPEHGSALFERVKAKFAAYPQVRVVKGLIPEVFEEHCPERVAYLHIDLNQGPAELAALDRLFDRLVPGGLLILDDYEWAGVYRGQKLSEDPWFERRGYRVMPLPTGQGLVVKR